MIYLKSLQNWLSTYQFTNLTSLNFFKINKSLNYKNAPNLKKKCKNRLGFKHNC